MTGHFAIAKPVEFVDVHVDRDNKLYVDPSAIRFWANNGDFWAQGAYSTISGFFDEFLRRLWSGSAPDEKKARDMLLRFREPRETRLGMSAFGFNGSGTSEKIGHAIWISLKENPLCTLNISILKKLEDIPLFVDEIANDRVSDLTTRLIFRELASFTKKQMAEHPTLKAAAEEGEFQVWDSNSGEWVKEVITLPFVKEGTDKGKALLLVPKRAVHRNLRMSHGKYWQGEVLGSVQDDLTTYGANGKPIKPAKKDLGKREEYRKKRPLNISRTHQIWIRDNFDLLETYRQRVDDAYVPLSDEEIEKRLGPSAD
ncbi:hypothetical protein [Streptomyces sp. LaPpAH-108]|uniref:hypothetical protein n=1 Tax=Streptomyces sp. LaPpAH-108 TaxID=1155714 RepID=UPI0003A38688|nr:hypothetical protein [Streptomyces sp. LaPpAH-108]